jgi:hypothetical protein
MKTCLNRPTADGVWQSSIHLENVYSVPKLPETK